MTLFGERCPMCGGRQEQGSTTFTVDKGNMLVVVRNVPAMTCRRAERPGFRIL